MTKKLSESKIRTEYFVGYGYAPSHVQYLEVLVSLHLESATIVKARGVWKGELEDSAVVVEIGDGEINLQFIDAVKEELYQEAVLVTQTPVQATIY